MSSSPLTETYTVKLDGSGSGSVSFGPTRTRQRWTAPLTLAVTTSTATLVPTAVVTMGAQTLGTSYTGSADSDDLPNVTVYPGQRITVQWTGGDPGAIASATIIGTVEAF